MELSKTVTRTLVSGMFAFASAGALFALPTLTISAPVSAGNMTCSGVINAGVCTDTIVGSNGFVTFNGAIGNWNLNFSDAGLDYPMTGTAAAPNLDFHGGGSSSLTNPGALTIVFSDIGFLSGGSPMTFYSEVGGTETKTQTTFTVTAAGANVPGLGYVAPGNIGGPGNPPNTSFSFNSAAVIVSPGNNYGIGIAAVINPDGPFVDRETSFNFSLTGNPSTPEPSFYALMALGLGGMMLVIVRRRRNQSLPE